MSLRKAETQPSVFASGKSTITRYTSAPQLRRLIYLFDLLRELVACETKSRYKRSILGVGWSLVNPLMQLVVLSFLFGKVVSLNIPNYPLFVFAGLLPWNWFTTSLTTATVSIVEHRDLVKWPGFPTAMLPAVSVVTHLVQFLIAFPLLFLCMLLWGGQWTVAMIMLPLVVTFQFGFTLGLAYLLAPLHVRFRDTQYMLNVFLMLAFYLTPVFYDTRIVPARYELLFSMNPMMHLISAYRSILIRGELPHPISLLLLGIFIAALLLFGYMIFIRASDDFSSNGQPAPPSPRPYWKHS
jgi:lipopolysaccharide transport system permease protein